MDAIVKADNNAPVSDEEEIINGLDRADKHISPKYFYDHRGSELFSQIMRLPEYYLTRTETTILQDNVNDIARYAGKNNLLIEPGAGNCEKITYLLEALHPKAFFPQDISHEFLTKTADQLKQRFDWLTVVPLTGDFHDEIIIPDGYPDTKRIVFYPGSTIGNFNPEIAADFLSRMRDLVGTGGGFIIGVDLQKDSNILNEAYNDSKGVTAAFNLNILSHLNQLVSTNFDITKFAHEAFYNSEKKRIEMHLKSLEDQTVTLGDVVIQLSQNERIHTENSYKYTLEDFQQLAEGAGLKLEKSWQDSEQLFSVHYLSVS